MFKTDRSFVMRLLLGAGMLSVGAGGLTHPMLVTQPATAGKEGTPRSTAKGTRERSDRGTWQIRASLEAATGRHHLAFAPDGKTLGTTGDKGEPHAKLVDLSTGRVRAILGEERMLEGQPIILYLAFSPDGKTLATNGSGVVAFWDAATGKRLLTLQQRTTAGPLGALAFAPDGRTLATVEGSPPETGWRFRKGKVKLWEVATGKERAILEEHRGFVTSVAFSPDGKTLASASTDGIVKLWDVATRQARAVLKGHADQKMVFSHGRVLAAPQVDELAFSPDGKVLATASHDKTVKLWEVATGKELTTLRGHTTWVRTVAFAPDSQTVASGDEDGVVKVWGASTAKEQATFHAYEAGGVGSVVFSPDGKVLATSGPGPVKLWERK